MKKGSFNIHLVDLPSEVSKGKNQSDRVHLCDKSKGLSVVDAFLLREAFCNQTSPYDLVSNRCFYEYICIDDALND